MLIYKKIKLNLIILITLIIILDQFTKNYINYNISDFLNNNYYLFKIDLVRNYGAAFNLFDGNRLFLSLISILSSIVLIYIIFTNNQLTALSLYGLSLILAGSIGNGIDRIIYGFVIDFINLTFINFPVFNIADISINIGFFLILYFLVKYKK